MLPKQIEAADVFCVDFIFDSEGYWLCRMEIKITDGDSGGGLAVDGAALLVDLQRDQLAKLCAAAWPPRGVQPPAAAAVVGGGAPCAAVVTVQRDGDVGDPVLFIVECFRTGFKRDQNPLDMNRLVKLPRDFI